MTQGSPLSEKDRTVILELAKEGYSSRVIADRVGRGKDAVLKVIRNGKIRAGVRRRGVRRKLPLRGLRLMIRAAHSGSYTAQDLQQRYAPMISVRRVQQLLAAEPTLKWEKMPSAPGLTRAHKQTRLCWARSMVRKGDALWRKVVFSDESRFTLDGPDGYSAHWQDTRKCGRWRSSRRFGGGSVMVWGAFSYRGKTELVFVDGNMDSSKYCSILDTNLIPFIGDVHPRGAVFQQDNASCHTSEYTKEWFQDMEVSVMDWPSRSPDLNPIENLWSVIGKEVYKQGRQFDTLDDLKEALQIAWENINGMVCKNLVNSMSDRLLAVIDSKGGPTSY